MEVVASALTIGEVAAQLSLALFRVAQAIKNAPKEMAVIGEEISSISPSLAVLDDLLQYSRDLCRDSLQASVHSILTRFKQVEHDITKLINSRGKLGRIKWFFKETKARDLLRNLEGIKNSLNLVINIIRLANEM